LAIRSTAHAWLPLRRAGEEVLRLRNRSLRAVLECEALTATPARGLGALGPLAHPAQFLLRARRATEGNEHGWRCLRASQAILMSRLAGGQPALLRRVLVTVPWDVHEGGDGDTLLERRVTEVGERLGCAGLDPVRLAGAELDAVAALDIVHEGRCEVHADGRLARTLIVTRLPEPLADDVLTPLDCEHDVSFHTLPASRPGHVGLAAYVTLWADTRGELDAATEHAEALLAARGMRARRPYLQAEPALLAAAPLGMDLIGTARVVPAAWPVIQGARAGDRSLLYGADPGTRQPLRIDRFALANSSALVLGRAEDRPRVLALEIVRARLAGIDVHVIDGTGAHARMIAALDGRFITPTGFDAFAVPDEGLGARLPALLGLIELVAGGLDPDVRAAVEDALAYVYAAHGYTHDGSHDGCEPPSLAEIAAALARRSAAAAEEMHAVAQRLQRFAAGAGRRLLAEHSSSPPRLGRLSVHDLASLPPDDRPPAALLVLDRLRRQAASGRGALIVLDGIDKLLSGGPGRFVAALMTAPAGLTVGTADVPAVLSGPLREATLAAGLKVLLRQEPAAAEQLGEALRLTPAEQSWLVRAAPDEGLLVTDDRRLAFRAVASDEEERLISGGTR
jgi:hypothetical protein